jgi:hypothetical protein
MDNINMIKKVSWGEVKDNISHLNPNFADVINKLPLSSTITSIQYLMVLAI